VGKLPLGPCPSSIKPPCRNATHPRLDPSTQANDGQARARLVRGNCGGRNWDRVPTHHSGKAKRRWGSGQLSRLVAIGLTLAELVLIAPAALASRDSTRLRKATNVGGRFIAGRS
jgi:hypothetical protein